MPGGLAVLGSTEAQRTDFLGQGFVSPAVTTRLAMEHPRAAVDVPGFTIDRTLVTVRDYAWFVRVGGAVPPYAPAGADAVTRRHGWVGLEPPDDLLAHPVTLVSHTDASAYCRWRGGRLPTEFEWEKAARGESGQMFPWGDRYDPARLNGPEAGPGDSTPVLTFLRGMSPHGLSDMAGNVRQWTATSGAAPGTAVVRGSDFRDPPTLARSAARDERAVDTRDVSLGFRCAGDLRP